MSDHLDPAAVARYLAGDFDAVDAREIEAHLASCISCRESIRGAVGTATEPATGPAPVLWRAERFVRSEPADTEAPGSADDPEAALRREAVRDFLGDLGRTLAVRGEREVDRLLALSEHERRRAIRSESAEPAELTEDVAARLLARCRQEWSGDLGAAVEAAKLAVLVAQSLTPSPGGDERLGGLRSLALQHLAASNRIARRAGEIDVEIARRRLSPTPSSTPITPGDDSYPLGIPAYADSLSEVAEDALSVEIEAALDDLRDASLARGRSYDAALAILDRARLALDRGGASALIEISRSEAARFAALDLAAIPRDALRHLAAEAERGAADRALLAGLTRRLLDAGGGFDEPFAG